MTANPSAAHLSAERVRQLNALDLGLVKEPEGGLPTDDNVEDELGIGDEDAYLNATLDLLDTYGGIILTGPPGTSKSWYAYNIALKLTKGSPELVRFVQFHPSYQYEDFVEGYVPNGDGGFDLRPKHLMELCALAEAHAGEWVVLVIDELSRGEPGRIFGEALTYVEKTKRGMTFNLASGTELSIPDNLVFLATMNPLDRGVDEVDAAFERRFAKIAMDPDEAILRRFLTEAGMDEPLRERVLAFFRVANGHTRNNPYAAIGHTFFLDISNEAGLRRLWNHQLRFLFDKAYQLDNEGLADVVRAWEQIFGGPPAGSGANDATDEAEATAETP